MAEPVQFTIGTGANCSDGFCGEVIRVVIDPVARTVTHLVVEPKHHHGSGRLVPLSIVEAKPDEVRLDCTMAEFAQLDPAEEQQFISGSSGYAGYEPGQVLAWPYYSFGAAGMGGGLGMEGPALSSDPALQAITCEAVPEGEVTVRRGEHVHATDGDIGRVQGLVMDPRSRRVTHVLLQEGHLWGRKEVAIPIGAVATADDGVQLTITKQEVQDLPAVNTGREEPGP
jgi:sporulation protein YlmC with PRC-barrel domain